MTEWDDLTHEASAWEPDAERLATAHLRQAPSFLIIGTQKGGTSSLHHYLSRNNSVRMAIKKEVHFFDSYFGKGLAWYLAHFARREDAVITGEASPSYLMHPLVPRRVHGAFPQMRLIALLRNPVDRAYSHYQMNVRKGIEALSFEDAVEQEPSRLHDSDPDAAGGAFRRYSYVRRGLYAEQLQRWFQVFPREHVLLLRSEVFARDPDQEFRRVLTFLGLPEATLAKYRVRKGGDYPAMRMETRQRLSAYFHPFNRQLYDLIGEDLGWDSI